MEILHLTLKKKWFDMILSGEKIEEYREIKPYWIKRLITCNSPEEFKGENKMISDNIYFDVSNGHNFYDALKSYHSKLKDFDRIVFKNGYSKNSPSFEIECLTIEVGKPVSAWSDNWQREVFVIKLGKIINP